MSSMSDSTVMTIEFLRARLLSERSVSRTSRQRADQLAKRVAELEEQLRIVTIQRKKAEKAATDVLSILVTQGIGDFSEVVDSSSEQDGVPCGRKESDDNSKEDESSTTSRMDRSEVDDGYSGSEHDVSPSQGRNLSWKGNNHSQEFTKQKRFNQDMQMQRRNSLMHAVDSSARHRQGKSCRKLKRKDMIFSVENGMENSLFHDVQEREVSTQVVDDSNGFNECLDISYPCGNGVIRDGEMEQALEQQAQLIRQYQAEEKSQSEWEQKFNEINSPAAESTEHKKTATKGQSNELKDDRILSHETLHHDKESICNKLTSSENQANIIATADETSDASKSHASSNVNLDLSISGMVTSLGKGATCSPHTLDLSLDVSKNQRQSNVVVASGSGCQEFEFSGQAILCRRGKEDKFQGLWNDNSDISSHNHSSLRLLVNGSPGTTSRESILSARSSLKFSNGLCSDVQNRLQTWPSHSHNSGLGVLEALKLAKLSLKQEINRAKVERQIPWMRSTNPHVSTVEVNDIFDIPVGSAGLFRLPTDASTHTDISRHAGDNFTSRLTHSDLAFAISSHRTLAPPVGSLSRIVSPGMQDFGLPVHSTVHSHSSRDSRTVLSSNDDFQKNYPDKGRGGVARDAYSSIFGMDRAGSDLRRT